MGKIEVGGMLAGKGNEGTVKGEDSSRGEGTKNSLLWATSGSPRVFPM